MTQETAREIAVSFLNIVDDLTRHNREEVLTNAFARILREHEITVGKLKTALEAAQQWIEAWDVSRADGRLTDEEMLSVISAALQDAPMTDNISEQDYGKIAAVDGAIASGAYRAGALNERRAIVATMRNDPKLRYLAELLDAGLPPFAAIHGPSQ